LKNKSGLRMKVAQTKTTMNKGIKVVKMKIHNKFLHQFINFVFMTIVATIGRK